MKIHEYQAKQIMKMYGISVPNGSPAFSPEEAARIAKDFDAMVNRLLVEEGSNIEKEYYLGFVIDRETANVVMMGSSEGGMEIEKVAAEMPDRIFKEYIDPTIGLMPFQTKRMAYNLKFKDKVVAKAQKLMMDLYVPWRNAIRWW